MIDYFSFSIYQLYLLYLLEIEHLPESKMILPKRLCSEYVGSHDCDFLSGLNAHLLDDVEIKNK